MGMRIERMQHLTGGSLKPSSYRSILRRSSSYPSFHRGVASIFSIAGRPDWFAGLTPSSTVSQALAADRHRLASDRRMVTSSATRPVPSQATPHPSS